MEMGDLFHWTQAIGRGAFEAPYDPPSQHRLPGFHFIGRYQRDLRQRSRKGRLQPKSHTIMSTLVSDWRGANTPLMPYHGAGKIAPTTMTEQEILCTRILLSLRFSSPSIPVSTCNKHRKPSSHLSAQFLQAVDRVGRTARRSMDTHIRNIFSQPRACTSIRRLSALFAFSADLRRLRCTLQLTRVR